MTDYSIENLGRSFEALKMDLTVASFSAFAEENKFTCDQIQAIDALFEHLRRSKEESTIYTLQKMSRLPLKNPKTFDNFDFSVVKGKDCERLKELRSLATIHAHKNLAFIGPSGTGKTHLAQAYGYECCLHGFKTYFIKMSELRDKFTAARRAGNESKVLNNLVRPSCLIIDEVGHCEFDKENTRLFFDLIDRRYNKEGSFNIVFTSNKNPSRWSDNFKDDSSLLCSLDRAFDDATVFTFRGESFRGKNLETIELQTSKVKPEISETSKN
jgi:DNA replication protein DnaC